MLPDLLQERPFDLCEQTQLTLPGGAEGELTNPFLPPKVVSSSTARVSLQVVYLFVCNGKKPVHAASGDSYITQSAQPSWETQIIQMEGVFPSHHSYIIDQNDIS